MNTGGKAFSQDEMEGEKENRGKTNRREGRGTGNDKMMGTGKRVG